jgi:Domain of unknown function (DUF1905)
MIDPESVHLVFAAELFAWRGPSPYHFVAVPADGCEALRAVAADVTYGWGMIPVRVRIGRAEFTTALWPRDGGYVVPVKDRVRASERLEIGDVIEVELALRA